MKRPRAKGGAKLPSIVQAMRTLFAPWFRDPATWTNWTAFLSALFGLALDPGAFAVFTQCTGRTMVPMGAFNEAWLIVGRRGGKSIVLALIAVFLAVFKNWSDRLVPGERGTILVIAADKKQARVIFRYITALITETTLIASLVDGEPTQEIINLTNGISIEISTANFRSVRGYTLVACLCDEIAFWQGDDSANPDTEILNAIRPAMATMAPDAMLLCASSPYAQRGALFEAFKKHYGKDNSQVLVWKASTKTMNPSVPQSVIEEAYEKDASAAAAEYGAEFRTDVERLVSAEVVEGCIVEGRFELPPVGGVVYSGFADPSGGSADSMTLAITHRDGDKVVLDLLREVKPPFAPDQVVSDFASLLKNYRINNVTSDRYAGLWVVERFKAHGVDCLQAAKPKSDLYRDLLPILNSGDVELLDHPRLKAQLIGLERRTARGGRDSIDHAPGAHDDVANAAAGAIVAAAIASGGAEGWIEFLRRQVEDPNRFNTDLDSIRAAGPEFGWSFANEPFVTLAVPAQIAPEGGMYVAGRFHSFRHLGADTIVEVRPQDAREIVSTWPAWRTCNPVLANELGGEEVRAP